jgi:CRP/FNR family cyclic AMP-dependent transcriptional regulator
MTDVSILSLIPLFSRLSPEELGMIAGQLKRQVFQVGEEIFAQGEPGDAMFIISEGRVRIFSQGEGGQELTLNVYEKGDFFGEFSLIDGESRSASAAAIDRTEALVLRLRDLIDILSGHPQIAISLMRGLVSRLRYTTEYAEELAFLSVNGRVTSKLLSLMDRHGEAGDGGIKIVVPVSVPQLAGMAVAPPEIVQRILDFYELGGILSREGETLTIRDPDTLRERVEMYRKKQLS